MRLPPNWRFGSTWIQTDWGMKCISEGVGYWPYDYPDVQVITIGKEQRDKILKEKATIQGCDIQ